MTVIAPPTNRLTALINVIVDTLLKGFGEDAAIVAAISAEPILATGFGNWFLIRAVRYFGDLLDTNIKINVDNIAIRFQNGLFKDQYDATIAKMKQTTTDPGVSNANKLKAIQAAKDAADAIIHRSK